MARQLSKFAQRVLKPEPEKTASNPAQVVAIVSQNKTFECHWCKIEGLEPEEYTHPSEYFACEDIDGYPICETCADNAKEEKYFDEPGYLSSTMPG